MPTEVDTLRFMARRTAPAHLFGGPEQRGEPPLHQRDAELNDLLVCGLIEHCPGKGYRITSAGLDVAGVTKTCPTCGRALAN